MTTHETKVLIIGSGPAGYTAAIYAARANLKPVQVLGLQPGGQLMITTDVENYPGFKDVIQGPWLMEQMKAQAEHVGTELVYDNIVSVDFSVRPFRCVSERGTVFLSQAVIISTGAQAKWLGLESEEKFRGAGVSGCATCDGFFFRGKKVAVIGGGNTAVEDALFMTHHASEVILVHRKDTLRAEKILQERLLKHPKVTVIWDSVVEEIIGKEAPKEVTHLKLKNTKTDALQTLDVNGVFVAIGHSPATAIFKGQVELDDQGYIMCKQGGTETSVKGVFAAGDVQDKVYRQAVTAAGQGCMAALDVDKYLSSLEG
jgi:thioredoxin reductase (NADPH)